MAGFAGRLRAPKHLTKGIQPSLRNLLTFTDRAGIISITNCTISKRTVLEVIAKAAGLCFVWEVGGKKVKVIDLILISNVTVCVCGLARTGPSLTNDTETTLQ